MKDLVLLHALSFQFLFLVYVAVAAATAALFGIYIEFELQFKKFKCLSKV